MKGYEKPKEFTPGICFLCHTATEDEYSVVHVKCAISYSDEKEKRKEEANKIAKENE